MLRDKYGVPDVEALCGKSITKVLKAKNQLPDLPEDVTALMRRAAAINKHFEANRHDQTAKRGLLLTESKINRLVKYYKTTGRIPETWKYNLEQAGYLLG
jgi:small subunit ribosomal protein S15